MAGPKPKLDVEGASSANTYAILAKLATGGMAELFLARTVSTAGVERYVVLKRVLPNRVKDTNFVAMFLDEAKLVSQLQHPNIAQIFDTGMLGDSYFFSMEYVHGETVRELIHRAKQLEQLIPLGCAVTIIAQAAAGLHHAHERLGMDGKPLGIVHRDVSPSNLMVTYEGNIKVVDFGVAKATRRSVETQAGLVKGKIGYLAPEQARGRDSDRRSDLFSLGIVLWELLVGDRLYKRENDYDTMEAIVLDPPPAPSLHRKEVPADLDALVLKLLAKAPGDRYQTALELQEDLEKIADTTGIRVSTAALRRNIVELCGMRPEPWIEMQARDSAQEIVTVSAAVIGGLDTVLTSLTDSQLQSVPDLTNTPSAPRRTPTPLAFAAADGFDDDSELSGLGASTAKEPATRRPAIAPSHAQRVALTKPGSHPTMRVRGTSTRNLILLALVTAALTLLVVWLAFFRGGPDGSTLLAANKPDTNVANPDTAKPDMHKPDTTKPDTADTHKPDTADTHKPDTADTTKPDTHKPDTTKPDTTKPDTADTHKPDTHKPDTHKPDHAQTPKLPVHDIATNMRAGKFDEVVAACVVTPKALAQNLASCTLAACQVHDGANAHAWFARLPAKHRDTIATQCSSAGTVLVEAAKKPEPDPNANKDKDKIKPPGVCDDPDGMSCRK